jgi:hypothetical protein
VLLGDLGFLGHLLRLLLVVLRLLLVVLRLLLVAAHALGLPEHVSHETEDG